MQFNRQTLILSLAVVTGIAPAFAETVSSHHTPAPVRLIAFNDLHGYLSPTEHNSTSTIAHPAFPQGVKVNTGGLAYMATLISTLKAGNPNNVVVAAGDNIGASPFTSNIAHDEPTVDMLNKIGLEVSSIGNHEFDKGLPELKRIQGKNGTSTCYPGIDRIGKTCLMPGNTFSGAKWTYLAANVVDKVTGRPIFPSAYLKKFRQTKSHAATTVGFIGTILKSAPSLIPPSTAAGLVFKDEVATINQTAAELKMLGANAVVVLIHQGGLAPSPIYGDNTCPGFMGDILPIVDGLSSDVDVIVSGHTHKDYICHRNGKLVTQSGSYGIGVTSIDLTFDRSGKVASAAATNNPVINDTNTTPYPDGIVALAKSPSIDAAIKHYAEISAAAANTLVGTLAAPVPAHGPDGKTESPMGDLTADAELGAFQEPGTTQPGQIAFVQAGAIRAGLGSPLDSYPNAPITYSALFATNPFHDNLIAVDMTGAQIKQVLEQQWEAPNNTAFVGAQSVGEQLMPSSGFSYTWDSNQPAGMTKGQGNRVVASTMMLNGEQINSTSTYRVVISTYLFGGGDNFTGFKVGQNPVENGVDIDALVAYMAKHPNYAPPTQNRVTKLGNNP